MEPSLAESRAGALPTALVLLPKQGSCNRWQVRFESRGRDEIHVPERQGFSRVDKASKETQPSTRTSRRGAAFAGEPRSDSCLTSLTKICVLRDFLKAFSALRCWAHIIIFLVGASPTVLRAGCWLCRGLQGPICGAGGKCPCLLDPHLPRCVRLLPALFP